MPNLNINRYKELYESSQRQIDKLEKQLREAQEENKHLKKYASAHGNELKDDLKKHPTFELLMAILPNRIFYVDKNMVVQFANASCKTISLIPFEKIVGSNLTDVIGVQLTTTLQWAYKSVLAGKTFKTEVVFSNPVSGGKQNAIVHFVPDRQNGEVVGFYIIGSDITNLRQVESSLQITSRRLQLITDNLPALVGYVGRDDVFQYANKYYEKLFGIRAREMVGKKMREIFKENSIKYSEKHYELVFSGQEVRFEKEIKATADRPSITVDLSLLPDIVDGEILGFFSLGVDQTEIKKAQLEKEKSFNFLQSLIDNIPGWVGYIDQNYVYHFANEQYRKISTIPPNEIKGKVAHHVLGESMFAKVKPYFDRTLAGEVSIFEFEKILIDGDKRWILSSYFPHVNNHGEVEGAFIYALDITAQKELQHRIDDFRVRAEQERTQILKTFIENAAHEFKTPLATIMTGGQIMLKTTDSAKREKFSHNIMRAVREIDRLVNSMLRLTKLDSTSVYEFETLLPSVLIKQVKADFYTEIQDRNDNIVFTIEPNLPEILGNELDLRFAIAQILINAIQATPVSQQIQVDARQSSSDVIITVQDHGIGMDQDVLKQVFDRFFRQGKHHEHRGFGLGLPIAKKIIDIHQGTIEIASTEGVGTIVTVSFPIAGRPT